MATADMTGRTVVVTGGNSGIGKATAAALAAAGADVIIVSRNPAKGAAALEDIRRASDSQAVELVTGDLGSVAATRRLAADLLAARDHIHVLVNNAGVWLTTRHETPDGYEQTFAVNHLAPFLLTDLLLDSLKAAGRARVVNVSSAVHARGRLDFNDLHFAHRPYAHFQAYSDSKLCNILFTRELARRLATTDVTTNALHPGVVSTNFGTYNNAIINFGMKVMRPFILGPRQGARTSVHCASAPRLEGVTGRYFAKSREKAPSRRALRDEDARRLWKVSEDLVAAAS